MGSDHVMGWVLAKQEQREIKFESNTQGTKGKGLLVSVTISHCL
jgi:hypothetical protein